MPAVAAKKPTAYREGRADKTKKPSIEIEINPEGEEEEEGMEGQEMDAAKTSRKRSAKGAKSTKAPMDGDCGCGGGKAKKCTCDGGCGGYAKKMDRSDALTPQEYLAACDLGIQGRSRSYIRARLDATERLDLKCGKGSISPGEKCTKGAATKAVDPDKVVNQAGVREKDKYSFKKQQEAWSKHGGLGLGVAGAVAGALAGKGGLKGRLAMAAVGGAAGYGIGRAAGTAEGTLRAAGNRTARAYGRSRENGRRAQKQIAAMNPKWKAEYQAAKARGASRAELTELSVNQAKQVDKILRRNETQVWTNANRRTHSRRRDSIWAEGFQP